MKFLIFIVISLLNTNEIVGQLSEKDHKRFNSCLEKGIRRSYDEHNQITWFSSRKVFLEKSSSYSSTEIIAEVYFGVKVEDNQVDLLPLRIKHTLKFHDWVFFNEISILYGTLKEKREGKRKRYLIRDDDTQTNVRSGGVTEISDVVAPEEFIDFIKEMIKEPKPLNIRFSGDESYYQRFYGVGFKDYSNRIEPIYNTYMNIKKEFDID